MTNSVGVGIVCIQGQSNGTAQVRQMIPKKGSSRQNSVTAAAAGGANGGGAPGPSGSMQYPSINSHGGLSFSKVKSEEKHSQHRSTGERGHEPTPKRPRLAQENPR